MASVSEGRYRLYNALNTDVALTVYNAQAKNGSNVFVYANGSPERDTGFADVWQLSWRADGTAQLISAYAGKSLDVKGGSIKDATNVQIWTDNDSRAQAWDLVKSTTGRTATIGGTTYDAYYVAIHADPSYVLDVYGQTAASGKNVQLYSKEAESGTDQMWCLVPVPELETGGLVEVRAMASTSMAMGVSGGSTTDGASVTLSKATGASSQLWLATLETEASGEDPAKWSLRAWHSGKYLDAYRGNNASTHVNQRLDAYTGNGSDAQRWDIERTGSTTVGGRSADVVTVRSCLTGTGNPFYADAYDALHSSSPDVVLEAPRSTTSQQWAVMAAEPTDGFAPMPVRMGVVASVGDDDPATCARWDARAVPTWDCTNSWSPSGPNHFEWRRRRRSMSSATSAFGDWSDWTAWEVAGVTVEGTRAWLTEGVPEDERKVDLSASDGKLTEWEFQVRCALADEGGVTVGPAADCVVAFVGCPTVTVGATAGFSIDGLHLTYASDYADGTTELTLTSLKTADGTELLGESVAFAGLDESGTLLVTRESMGGYAPADGDALTATLTVGYDQAGATYTGGTVMGDVTVAYTASYDVSMSVAMGAGRMLAVACNAIEGGTNRLWVVANGTTTLCEGTVGGGKATYSVAYPFGRDLELWADAESADGDTWGTAMLALPASSALFSKYQPCHAWNWGDANEGAFALECRADSPMETTRTLSPEYEAYSLGGRARQAVRFGRTIAGEYVAEGLLYRGLTDSDVSDLLALQEARHAHYRAPSGESADVAVTGVEYTTHGDFTTVKVSMIEETL